MTLMTTNIFWNLTNYIQTKNEELYVLVNKQNLQK